MNWSEVEYGAPPTSPESRLEVAVPLMVLVVVGFPGEEALIVMELGWSDGLGQLRVVPALPAAAVTVPMVTSLVLGLSRTPPSVAAMQAVEERQARSPTGVARSTVELQVAVVASTTSVTVVDPEAARHVAVPVSYTHLTLPTNREV